MTIVVIKDRWRREGKINQPIYWLLAHGFSCHSFRHIRTGMMEVTIEPIYDPNTGKLLQQFKFNPGAEGMALLFKLTWGGV